MLVSGRVHGDGDPIVGLNELSTSYIYTTNISKSMSIPPCFHIYVDSFLLEYTEDFEQVSLLDKLGDMLPKTPEWYLSLKLCQCQSWPIGMNKSLTHRLQDKQKIDHVNICCTESSQKTIPLGAQENLNLYCSGNNTLATI